MSGNAENQLEMVSDPFLRWDEGLIGIEGARAEFKRSAVSSAKISAVVKHLLASTPESEQTEEFRKKIRRLEKLSPYVQAWILAKTIAGFANNDGGVLYLGVADCGVVTGLADSFEALKEKLGGRGGVKRIDAFQRLLRGRLRKMFRDGIFAGTLYEMEFRKTRKRKLEYCVISVRKSPTPIFVCDEPRLREGEDWPVESVLYENLFVRVGNTTELCPAEERARFIAARFGKVSPLRKFFACVAGICRRIFSESFTAAWSAFFP